MWNSHIDRVITKPSPLRNLRFCTCNRYNTHSVAIHHKKSNPLHRLPYISPYYPYGLFERLIHTHLIQQISDLTSKWVSEGYPISHQPYERLAAQAWQAVMASACCQTNGGLSDQSLIISIMWLLPVASDLYHLKLLWTLLTVDENKLDFFII